MSGVSSYLSKRSPPTASKSHNTLFSSHALNTTAIALVPTVEARSVGSSDQALTEPYCDITSFPALLR